MPHDRDWAEELEAERRQEAREDAERDKPKGKLYRCGGIGSFEGSCGATDCTVCMGANAVPDTPDEDDESALCTGCACCHPVDTCICVDESTGEHVHCEDYEPRGDVR